MDPVQRQGNEDTGEVPHQEGCAAAREADTVFQAPGKINPLF